MSQNPLNDILNSINVTKNDLMEENPDYWSKEYVPFVVNHCMMSHIDTIMFANEMNMRPFLDQKSQYRFFLHSVTKRKRYGSWLKPEKMQNLEVVKEYYGYSDQKAREAMRVLRDEDIERMKSALYKGGNGRKRK